MTDSQNSLDLGFMLIGSNNHGGDNAMTFIEYRREYKRLFQRQLDLVHHDGAIYSRAWKMALTEFVNFKVRYPSYNTRITTTSKRLTQVGDKQ